METVITLENRQNWELPKEFSQDDVRYPSALVERFLTEFTQPGDVVLDPFAGYGTTLFAAEKMGRKGYGVELLPQRVEFIRKRIPDPARIFQASALDLASCPLPRVDFSITSPPYMTKNDHPEYPFAGYQITGQGYEDYLRDIQHIYQQLAQLLRPGGRAAIEVCNIQKEGVLTTLAWDIARSVGEVLPLEKEYVIFWKKPGAREGYGFGYDHSYCLLFRKPL